MMKAFWACKRALENLDEETVKRIFQQLREETRDLPLQALDDDLDPNVAATLRQHGCTIENHTDYHRVIFPRGTTCQLLLVLRSSRSLLTLPSGLKVHQIGKANRNHSLLFIEEQQNNTTE